MFLARKTADILGCEEIALYKKVANLQYLPSDAEIRLIVSFATLDIVYSCNF
ncbi:MAG TPA: hypothetical protein EYP08_04325 [Pyrodictiaceae archaeon]|nr:hypothetical protein [Pyrodictiaceae archaeon]